MNIFKEMGLSIFSYKSYKEFLNNKKSKVFGFGVVLMIIYFTITMIAPFVKVLVADGGLGTQLDELIPDFELKDGYLWIDDVIEYDDGDMYVYIDTDPEYYFYGADEMREYLYDYSQAILMDSEKIIVKNDGQVQELYYSDLGEDFTKDDLMAIVPTIYVCIVIFMILAFIWMTGLFFFGVLFVGLMGMIVASCMKRQLTFGQLYLLGVYSRTLPLLIKAILSLFSLNLNVLINFGISLVIMILAIKKMGETQLQQPLEFTSNNMGYGNNGYSMNGYNTNNNANGYSMNGNNYGGNFSSNYNNNGNYGNGADMNNGQNVVYGSANMGNDSNTVYGSGDINNNAGNDSSKNNGNDFSWMQ